MPLRLIFTDTQEIHDLYALFSGKLAFDIGANGGQTANVFAEHFEQVVACEPSPRPYGHLATHIAENVLPLNIAVSSTDGDVHLQEREMSEVTGYLFTGNTLPEWGEITAEHVVPGLTLKSLIKQCGTPDFVKIDTEGHEVQVVEGSGMLFANLPQFLIEIHSEANGQWIAEWLDELGVSFRIVRHADHPVDSYRWHNHYWMVKP